MESEIIIAGNPAKKIGTWNDLIFKYKPLAFGAKDFCNGKKIEIENHLEKIMSNR